jgi:hypothetical protein
MPLPILLGLTGIAIFQGVKYLLSDDSSSESGSNEAEQRAQEARRQQAQKELQQQRQAARRAVDLALRSLCTQYDISPAPLAELPYAPTRGEQQLLQALAQQSTQAQSPYQQRLDTLDRALQALDKLA